MAAGSTVDNCYSVIVEQVRFAKVTSDAFLASMEIWGFMTNEQSSSGRESIRAQVI